MGRRRFSQCGTTCGTAAGTKASGGTTLLHDIRPSWSKVCSYLIEERLHVIACNARGYHSATKNFFTISPVTVPILPDGLRMKILLKKDEPRVKYQFDRNMLLTAKPRLDPSKKTGRIACHSVP
ncbi:unnamed protein product [Acanthoscelides obtectus]|uniref:Uncharacterized protein n=1 Tax=Acanthoscelides obtectus TaxID=200917 RepID=A0A9P0P926_ACAOB|nr:unnamed protein product [Acanthoscelides obtectus]CAK1661626.1 hypothetical protein AOBTE_LOCUS22725 [Acanthoscelides obtectus]